MQKILIHCYVKLKAQKVNSIGTVNDRCCNTGLHQGKRKQRRHAKGRKNVLSFIYLLCEVTNALKSTTTWSCSTVTHLVYKWSRRLKMVHLVSQMPLDWPNQTAVTMLAPGKTQHVTTENHYIIVNNMDPKINITCGAVYCILHNELQFHKAGSFDNKLLNWRKGTWTTGRDFYDDMQQQAVDNWSAQWLDMDTCQILPASYTDGKQRMVPFQLNITQKFCTWTIVWKVMLT